MAPAMRAPSNPLTIRSASLNPFSLNAMTQPSGGSPLHPQVQSIGSDIEREGLDIVALPDPHGVAPGHDSRDFEFTIGVGRRDVASRAVELDAHELLGVARAPFDRPGEEANFLLRVRGAGEDDQSAGQDQVNYES